MSAKTNENLRILWEKNKFKAIWHKYDILELIYLMMTWSHDEFRIGHFGFFCQSLITYTKICDIMLCRCSLLRMRIQRQRVINCSPEY